MCVNLDFSINGNYILKYIFFNGIGSQTFFAARESTNKNSFHQCTTMYIQLNMTQ